METVFLSIVSMSITAGYVILAVMLARLLLKNAPKKYSYALWGAVAFRLCCPVTLKSAISFFNLKIGEKGNAAMDLRDVPTVFTSSAGADTAAAGRDIIYETVMPATGIGSIDNAVASETAAPHPDAVRILAFIWAAGVLAIAVYGIISYLRIRKKVASAIKLQDNVWEADDIGSPFIFGFIRPRIYIPFGLGYTSQRMAVLHEKRHIARYDHITKMAAFMLLALHWFNPLCWLAFELMTKDMEMSCDESVLDRYGNIKRIYSLALLSFATEKRFPAPSPVAFGETSVKVRIGNILSHKKTRMSVTVVSVVLVAAVLFGCATNPVEQPGTLEFNPMTGLESEGLTAEPIAVTVRNTPSARPFYGLDSADVVYEYEVAGGVTRYTAVFSSLADISGIGPVFEMYDVSLRLTAPYGAVSVCTGPSQADSEKIKAAASSYGAEILDGSSVENLYHTDASRVGQYAPDNNYFVSMDVLSDTLDKLDDSGAEEKEALFSFADEGHDAAAGGMPADRIEWNFSSRQIDIMAPEKGLIGTTGYKGTFEYDPSSGKYRKVLFDGIGTDGESLMFDNVFLVIADGSYDPRDEFTYELAGGGTAYYFSHGQYIECRWDKGSGDYDEPLRFVDTDGNDIAVSKGTSYIGLLRYGMADSFKVNGIQKIYFIDAPAEGSMIVPLADYQFISRGFSIEADHSHSGIDYAARLKTEAYAAYEGVVTKAEFDVGYGNYVIIDHGGDVTTMYAHLDSFTVEAGQHVMQGDLIGYVGSTGNSTGPHLHFGVSVGGEYVDPEIYLMQ